MKFIKALETEDEQLIAIKQSGWKIEYIINPSEQVKLEAVKQNGAVIKYINNPSEEIQTQAVKQNGNAILFIYNPPIKLQNLYLFYCLKYNMFIRQKDIKDLNVNHPKLIKSPKSIKRQLQIITRDPYNIIQIENPSEQVQLHAVKQDGYVIQYIHNPSEEIKSQAAKQNGNAIPLIHGDPSIQFQNLYLSHCLKHNQDVHQKFVKDLDPTHIQNLIDCKELIE